MAPGPTLARHPVRGIEQPADSDFGPFRLGTLCCARNGPKDEETQMAKKSVKKKKAVKKKKVKLARGRRVAKAAKARKPARKAAKKPAKKAAKKTARKPARKPAPKKAKKPVKKVVPEVVAPVVDMGDLSGGASGLDEVSSPGIPRLF